MTLPQLVAMTLVVALVAYPVVQYRAIRAARGGWRIGASLPVAPMVLLWAVNIALHQPGSAPVAAERLAIWQLRLVCAAPAALIYLAILGAARRRLAGPPGPPAAGLGGRRHGPDHG
jgi:hypothetical protein